MTPLSHHLDKTDQTVFPDAVRERITQVITVEYIGHGTRNHHWRIHSTTDSYIWRAFGNVPPGANRSNERQVLTQLQGETWVPELVLDLPEGLLFKEETKAHVAIDPLTQSQREQLLKAVMTLWRQPTTLNTMDYCSLIEHYACMAKGFCQSTVDRLLLLANDWKTEDFCLIHQDIHAENLLITPTGIQLIDWEYTTRGNSWIDAVALDRMLLLTEREKQQLLEHLPVCTLENPWLQMRDWLEGFDQLWHAAQLSQHKTKRA